VGQNVHQGWYTQEPAISLGFWPITFVFYVLYFKTKPDKPATPYIPIPPSRRQLPDHGNIDVIRAGNILLGFADLDPSMDFAQLLRGQHARLHRPLCNQRNESVDQIENNPLIGLLACVRHDREVEREFSVCSSK